MMPPLLAMSLVVAVLGGMMLGLRLWQLLAQPKPEVTRKLLHVGMGMVVLSFPWLFHQTWPVVALGVISAALLGAMRWIKHLRTGVGSIVLGVERQSYGEIYYPLTVSLLFVLSGGDKLLFSIPVLILALADAVAALIGITYGRIRYTTADGVKSAEGSIAFFTVAFFSVHIPLLLFTDIGRAQTLLISLILGLLVMLMEAASWRGLDNLFIPLGGYALLDLYMHESTTGLLWRLGATVALVVFVMLWRRRSTLDDSSLIGSALFGYAAWMLGGWPWLAAPVCVFVIHALLWSRAATGQHHHIFAVMSVAAAGLIWLFAYAWTHNTALFYPYNVSFAAHLAIIGVSRLPWSEKPKGRYRWTNPFFHSLWAIGLVLEPLILLQLSCTHQVTTFHENLFLLPIGGLFIFMGASCFYLLLPKLYHPKPKPFLIHFAGAVLGILVSLASYYVAHLM